MNGKHPYLSVRTAPTARRGGVPVEELCDVEAGPAMSDPSFQEAVADRYLIDREIGHRGMGIVHLARDVKPGRVVATGEDGALDEGPAQGYCSVWSDRTVSRRNNACRSASTPRAPNRGVPTT